MARRVHTYEGRDIEVQYDVQRCIHAARCVKGLPVVFDPDRRPWVQPDSASADDVAGAVTSCPTGALRFVRQDGGEAEPKPVVNTIRLVAGGPLYVHGDVTITGADGSTLLTDTRAALCRCGQSKNMPLCDAE